MASLAVRNLDTAAKWYEQILNQSSSRPMPELAEWTFPDGGGLQVYQLPVRAGSGSCSLLVNNLDEHVAHVQKLGIDVSERTAGPQVKTLMITDPDGNHIAFAETRP